MRALRAVLLVAAFAAAASFCVFPAPLGAQNFPPIGDDLTTSLGSFRIWVHPDFQPLVTGCPGYNAGTVRWDSPVLFDPSTVIGRSGPHQHGDAVDIGGAVVGIAGTIINDAMFTIMPPGFQGPLTVNEVHTEVVSLNMTGGPGMAVRAGTFAPGRPTSPGEVESKTLGGFDFPAESFFDVYVEVDLPACGAGFPGGTVYNSVALMVADTLITGFPPHVVYIHKNSTAVPVVFLTNDPGGAWVAGQLFGYLVLAGHGISYNQAEQAEFEEIMAGQEEMALPTIPTVTTWGIVALVALLLIVGTSMWIRRRRRMVPA